MCIWSKVNSTVTVVRRHSVMCHYTTIFFLHMGVSLQVMWCHPYIPYPLIWGKFTYNRKAKSFWCHLPSNISPQLRLLLITYSFHHVFPLPSAFLSPAPLSSLLLSRPPYSTISEHIFDAHQCALQTEHNPPSAFHILSSNKITAFNNIIHSSCTTTCATHLALLIPQPLHKRQLCSCSAAIKLLLLLTLPQQ